MDTELKDLLKTFAIIYRPKTIYEKYHATFYFHGDTKHKPANLVFSDKNLAKVREWVKGEFVELTHLKPFIASPKIRNDPNIVEIWIWV